MFTRFYASILVAVLISIVVNYVYFKHATADRAQNYSHDSLQGAIHILTDALSELPDKSKQAFLETAAQLLGAQLAILDVLPSSLTPEQQVLLQKNAYVLTDYQDLSTQWIGVYGPSRWFSLTLPSIAEQQFRAVALLLVAKLKATGPPYQLELLEPYVAKPVSIKPISELEVDPQQYQNLLNRRVVVRNVESDAEHFSVFVPVGNDLIFVLGPLPHFILLTTDLTLSMILSTIAILMAVSYWMVFILSRRIQPIAAMIEYFGKGNLDVRVRLAGGDHFSLLGKRINDMADQIKCLIESQKSILGAVSHEFRTPLARMRFKLAFIDDEQIGQQSVTDPIRNDIDQLELLVDEIIEYCRLTQQPSIQVQALDFQQLVDQIVDNLTPLFNGVNLQTKISNNIVFKGDHRGVARLLQNLCSNACKHAQQHVLISIIMQDKGIEIRIEDDGPGISDADKQKVFDAYFRANSHTNQVKKGYGLGLSIVKQITILHQGHLSVGDSLLGGAAFIVFLRSIKPETER